MEKAIYNFQRVIQLAAGLFPGISGIGPDIYPEKKLRGGPYLYTGRAVRLNSNSRKAYLGLAQTYRIGGLHGEALKTYRTALEIDPNSAAEINPQYSETCLKQGCVYQKQKKHLRGIKDVSGGCETKLGK